MCGGEREGEKGEGEGGGEGERVTRVFPLFSCVCPSDLEPRSLCRTLSLSLPRSLWPSCTHAHTQQQEVLRRAIAGMLPKNTLRRERLKLLRIFAGPQVP